MICAENSIFICISLCRRMKKRFSLLANNRNSNDTIIFVQKTASSQHDYALSVLRMCGNPLKGVRMIFVELIFLTIRSIPLSPLRTRLLRVFRSFCIWIWVIKYIVNEKKMFLFLRWMVVFVAVVVHLNDVVIAIYICFGRLFSHCALLMSSLAHSHISNTI